MRSAPPRYWRLRMASITALMSSLEVRGGRPGRVRLRRSSHSSPAAGARAYGAARRGCRRCARGPGVAVSALGRARARSLDSVGAFWPGVGGLWTRRRRAGTRRAARLASVLAEAPDGPREVLPDGAPADEAGEGVEHQGCGGQPDGGVAPASGEHVPGHAEAQVEGQREG